MNTHLITAALALALGGIPAWWLTADHYQGVIAKAEVERQAAVIKEQEKSRDGLLAYAQRIIDAGAQHDQDTRTITDLRRERDKLRINFPTCPAQDGSTAATGTDRDGSARLLSDRVDAAFAEFQEATGRLVERADALNIDARRRNAEGCPQ